MFGSSIAASIQRVRLLKRWAEQGVGPRVTWRTRKFQDLLAAGKSIDGVDIDALDDDEEAKRQMYPPRATAVPLFSMKSRFGYTAGPGLVESLGQKRPDPTLAGE
jgi:G patch domain-containing protein 1